MTATLGQYLALFVAIVCLVHCYGVQSEKRRNNNDIEVIDITIISVDDFNQDNFITLRVKNYTNNDDIEYAVYLDASAYVTLHADTDGDTERIKNSVVTFLQPLLYAEVAARITVDTKKRRDWTIADIKPIDVQDVLIITKDDDEISLEDIITAHIASDLASEEESISTNLIATLFCGITFYAIMRWQGRMSQRRRLAAGTTQARSGTILQRYNAPRYV